MLEQLNSLPCLDSRDFSMQTASFRHATSFVLGALGGGLAVAIVSTGRKRQLTAKTTSSEAVVQVDTNGTPQMSSDLAAMATVPPMLKYGNPGSWHCLLSQSFPNRLPHSGPIADILVRKGYIAAYDRRLRHPAWVRIVPMHS
jgi:endonuclease G